MTMGIAFGIVGGLVTSCFYKEKPKYFYLDTEYFDNAHFREIYRGDTGENAYLNQKEPKKAVNQAESQERIELEPHV